MRYMLVVLAILQCSAIAVAQDLDQNGLSDTMEVLLAERFKPTILMHRGNFLEPEPVEILDTNGNQYLDAGDAMVMEFFLTGAMVCNDWYCTCLPTATVCSEPSRFYNQYMRGYAHQASGLAYMSYFDYGGSGNEDSSGWESTYLYGRGVTRPGSDYEPTTYCHFKAVTSQELQLQYWFFYPFDDAFNNHEGDWEYITVHTTNQGAASQVTYVDYSIHDNVWPVPNPLVVDGTHPLVCVGGACNVYSGGNVGEITGANWPCFGVFEDPNPIHSLEPVIAGGTTIPYDALHVKIMPDFDMYSDGNRLTVADLTPWNWSAPVDRMGPDKGVRHGKTELHARADHHPPAPGGDPRGPGQDGRRGLPPDQRA